MKRISILFSILALSGWAYAQNHNPIITGKFEQLGPELPTPNVYRTASGAPGHMYWQQKADYKIDIELDDAKQSISGSEVITYTNNAPEPLTYLWLQLDQNTREKNAISYQTDANSISPRMGAGAIDRVRGFEDFDGGFKIKHVKDAAGKDLPYTINFTMMRIDLPKPLANGESFDISIAWSFNINDRMRMGGRSGYEFFPEDGNYLYTIAQFFPRMAVYSDFEGWQNKQFLGGGEFALPFGDYEVKITVPADHVVAATGELQNMSEVLSTEEVKRYEQSKTAKKPVIIVTQKEAERKEKSKAREKKTWVYKAENVRDFGFASSRKFIWDAMGVKIGDNTVMAMSYYPKEGNPLWEQYSTEVVAHTLRVYSKYTIDYPYPVAISVHADAIGMEYPMICFNFGRPEKDGTYSDRVKYGMIGVIIHEVGHNFFPMIVNSDERQWTWMDEGLNSFVQYLTEQEWDHNYPSRRGPAQNIVPYMKGDQRLQNPIMTNSEQVVQLGNNAYGKPATALNILRETVMGRELFDYAFKEYSRRWAFKHPTPADFFRTMEDASGVDLDWFWRGWFYSTDYVDISVEDVKWFKLDTKNPSVENPKRKRDFETNSANISQKRNKDAGMKTVVETNPAMKDFYNSYDPFEVTSQDTKAYQTFMASLNDYEKKLMNEDMNYYQIDFKNVGGLVMPLILEFTYKDGSKEEIRLPAEIWRKNEQEISKVFPRKKELVKVVLDPYRETADVETSNNYWPRNFAPDRFELFKSQGSSAPNPMQKKK